MKKNDITFGVLNFDVLWQRKEKLKLFNQEYDVNLIVQGEQEDEISDIQRKTYELFKSFENEILNKVENEIFNYYQNVYEEYRSMYDDEADEYAPIIESSDDLIKLVTPQSIMICNDQENRIINLLFLTKWDKEMGIGIQLVNERIVLVGTQCEVL
jgi:hypothetical protein